MFRLNWWLLGLACVLAGCATDDQRGDSRDLLALYSEANATGALGFRCYPAEGTGGNAQPRYEHIRRQLAARQGGIRDRLAARFGTAPLEQLESEFEEAVDSVYWTGCDVRETARTRQRYRSLLRELERRTEADSLGP